jgi:hypothetical protein
MHTFWVSRRFTSFHGRGKIKWSQEALAEVLRYHPFPFALSEASVKLIEDLRDKEDNYCQLSLV